MAAFIQKLFQKRPSSATRPDKRKSERAPAREQEQPQDGGPDNSQGAIDQQRAALSEPGTPQRTLAELAVDGLAADIRLEAARRLTDRELLQNVLKIARGKDKGVYQQIRQTLQEMRQHEEAARATEEALSQLIRQAGDLAATSDTNLYDARVHQLEQRWQALEASADNDARARVLAALHECRQRARELQQERQQAEQQQARAVQRQETLELLRDTLDKLAEGAPSVQALPSLDALQRTQENRWLEATRDADVSREEQKQYEQRMQQLRGAVSALRRLSHHQQDIDEILSASEPAPDKASELLDTLDWPREVARPEALQHLARIARASAAEPRPQQNREARPEQIEQLESVLTGLEQALEANQLKESRQYLKQALGLQRQLPPKAAGRYRARVQRLSGQVRELGD
ncbi:MAG: DUF349 domain-containing protein, partial [Marinobacter sp.]